MTSVRVSTAVFLLLALSACKVGPNYQRPPLTVPGDYRGVAPDASTQQPPAGEQFATMKWPSVYQDEVLQALIKEALVNNYDIRIAAARILQANASLGITRANQFPTVNGTGAVANERNNFFPGAPTFDSIGIQLDYIVDFWGQYRRATEAARATLLATEFGHSVVQTTLISSVASNYFQLRGFDFQLDYSQRSVEAFKEILNLNNIKFNGGDIALTDVYQAQALVQQAEAEVITLKQSIEQNENNISILLGRNPGPVPRGLSLTEQPHLPEVPAGLPSALLQRRPDIRRAEENLVAANANVGVAKAAFFPQFSITGLFGAQSVSITSFLQGPATFWSVGGQVAQPIFQGGRIRSNYRLAWAQRDEAELTYKQTVQQAFGDVSNSLVGYNQSRQYRIKIEEQTKTYRATAELANVRFRGGVTSFLEVQYWEQQYFMSELSLASAWYAELANYVQLYQALGGGWEQ
jgi:outer membrane protein, multidrug efflux system